MIQSIVAHIFVVLLTVFFVLLILNYIVVKIYFLKLLENKYKNYWESIGRPRFFDSYENLESILSLVKEVEDRPLKKKLTMYSKLYKIYCYVGCALLSIIVITQLVDLAYYSFFQEKYFLK